jgi:hypothetical protein
MRRCRLAATDIPFHGDYSSIGDSASYQQDCSNPSDLSPEHNDVALPVGGDAREALTAQLAVVGLPDAEARARDANFRIGRSDRGRIVMRESLR